MVGKVRLRHAPWMNHWWHMPALRDLAGADHVHHALRAAATSPSASTSARTAWSRTPTMAPADRSPSSRCRSRSSTSASRALLTSLEIDARIWPVPVEVVDTTPFPDDRHHATYDREQVQKLHRILLHIEPIFSTHRGRFLGKSSPVHFFWGAFDLAVTRFSGRPNPTPPEDPIMNEAYSHEVISHGFWPGRRLAGRRPGRGGRLLRLRPRPSRPASAKPRSHPPKPTTSPSSASSSSPTTSSAAPPTPRPRSSTSWSAPTSPPPSAPTGT